VPPPTRRTTGRSTDPARAQIVRDGIGVGVATGTYGISFGALGVAAGLDVWQTCALSLLMFTGASQFAFVGVLASGGAPLSGAVTAVLLGVRNGLYGMKLSGTLGYRGWRRAAVAHLVLDESTAMAVTRETPERARTGFLATGLAVFVCWNLATLAGALAGQGIGDPRDLGLDAAVGAAFLALLWPRLKDRRNVLVGVLAAAVALCMVPVTAPGVPVLAAGGVAVLVGVLGKRRDPTEIPGVDDVPGGHR
jgi:predicted branched-subunit amino acid permease